ncbi:MAG: FtsQ-type POTRA domain-containing protein [Candidatus Dormibacteria bacterium]
MSGAPLDPRTRHRARVRAVASSIADRPSLARRFQAPTASTLRSTQRRRRRSHPGAALPPPPRTDHRRLLTGLVLAVEVAALAVALWAPGFRIGSVSVTGTQLLSPAAVLRAAAVPSQSIFTLDGNAVASRVRSIGWVEDVTVTTELPGTVRIAVTEWPPIVRDLRDGTQFAVAADGASLRLTAAQSREVASLPLLVDLRPAVARTPISAQLMGLLATAGAHFPAIFGVQIIAYEWDANSSFSIWTSGGWRAILGDVDSPSAIAAVPGQLADLSALRADLDFPDPSFGYVDLEDPTNPAVGGSPGVPAQVLAALSTPGGTTPLGMTPTPPPTPTPTPKPSATPSPSPSAPATASPSASAPA